MATKELLYPWLMKPCVVRVLIVSDYFDGFSTGDFGLSELVNILSTPPGPYVTFQITKANRGADVTATTENFDFTNTSHFDPAKFDQIWFFGVYGTGSGFPLSPTELKIVSQFMDSGKGVFATGDHEDLGVSLSGLIPRVRTMRKWYYPGVGPEGEPVAPPAGGPDRLDTLSEGYDADYQFDDQSDDVPQYITPKYYYSHLFPYYWRWKKYPHPLLCSKTGVINVLPDHPHEGECIVPGDLTKSYTFDGYTTEEYPVIPGTTTRLKPEVIATSSVRNDRGPEDVKGVLNARTFGAISAYNGHTVNVGRVVCDATWHHFFNINLAGTPGGSIPEKQVGFKGSVDPVHQAEYNKIKSYFRNIAVWLSPKSKIDCMRKRLYWTVRWDSVIEIDFPRVKNISELSLDKLLFLGTMARDVLNRYAPQCVVTAWLIDLVPIDKLRTRLSIWDAENDPNEKERRADNLHSEMLIDALAAGVMLGLVRDFQKRPEKSADSLEKKIDETLSQAPYESLRTVIKYLSEVNENTTAVLADLSKQASRFGRK